MRKTISESSAHLKIWNYKRNKTLSPHTFTLGINQRVWWICDKGHEWNTLASRAIKTGCPFCAGRRASPENNLAIKHPKLAKEWHPKKNNNLSPTSVLPGTAKKAWWKCKKGHEWEASIRKRTDSEHPTGCPFCAGRSIAPDNNLAFLYPDIAKQWHPTKNGSNTPDMYTPGSHKKAWWICERGHHWKAAIHSRKSRGCPKCTNQTSEAEIRILTELMSIFDDATSRYKVDSLELDIFLPSFKIGIEYDGYYYHKNRNDKDKEKNIQIKKKGIKLIRLRQVPLLAISKNDITHEKQVLTKANLNELLSKLKPLVDQKHSKRIESYLGKSNFINQDMFNLYRSYFPDPFPENSLAHLFPELSKEWNYEKNKPLTPSNFTKGSGKSVWWKCKKGHEWQVRIDMRTDSKHPTGCPYCKGRKVGKDNNFAIVHPDLAKQWHPTKNGSNTPDMFTAGSSKKAWWICEKNHEWEAVIHSRKSRGCPYCTGTKAGPDNNFAVLFPEAAKQWHPTKNGKNSPEMFRPGSDKRAWWVCGNEHEWNTKINLRTRGHGCPYCAGVQKVKSKDQYL